MKPEAVAVLENARWPVLLVDGAGTVLRSNPAAVSAFGAALEGKTPELASIWSPENGTNAAEFLPNWERQPSPSHNLKFRVKDGSLAAFSVSICTFKADDDRVFLLQLLPAADAKHAAPDASAAHKQKLDCALQLARSVALDFNNALTTILGYTSLILSKAEPEHPWRRALLEVEKSAAKAAETANDLAEFSRTDKELRQQTAGNVNSILQRCTEFFQHSQTTPVTWQLQFDKRLFAAKFDEAKIQQAFMKIMENAAEAIKENGRVTVLTRNVELTEPTQDRNAKLAPGAYVCAEISDNGAGIEPDVLPRIFEPFFTTKKGPHRGLGLAWVYGIVTNHGGAVAVSSQPGAGASVRVYLPAEKTLVRESAERAGDLGGTETILMVDDEDLLLTMGETILTAYGYKVLTANSGQKALDLLAQSETPVALVITDLVMPAMSGRELVERIRLTAPDTRIICTSGYIRPSGQQEGATYLQKPFTSQELLMKVKEVIARADGS